MKQKYCTALITFILTITTGFSATDGNKIHKETLSVNQRSVFVPPKGSLMRKNILDALRNELSQTQGKKIVFVVMYLKATKDWAWIDTLPESSDGIDHYEGISALLHFEQGEWKVVELPCWEEENPECIGDPGYFMGLKKRFPHLPDQILPKE